MANMERWTYGRTIDDVITKSKICRIDGLPYFFNHGASCGHARGTPLQNISAVVMVVMIKLRKWNKIYPSLKAELPGYLFLLPVGLVNIKKKVSNCPRFCVSSCCLIKLFSLLSSIEIFNA